MIKITDEYMQQMIARTKEYSIVILKEGPNRHMAGAGEIIREHGRRNFALREEGLLPIICPVVDGSGVRGVGIFNTGIKQARAIMDEDPGVQEGIFTYEIHPCRSFPGDNLPG